MKVVTILLGAVVYQTSAIDLLLTGEIENEAASGSDDLDLEDTELLATDFESDRLAIMQLKNATHSEFTDGKPYKAKVPDMYSPGTLWEHMYDSNRIPHDALMYNLIKNYSKEAKDEDGKPNGRFYVDRKAAKEVTGPYVKKHLKLTGEKFDEYMTKDFENKF